MVSYQAVAFQIDRIYPPQSMRDLQSRFRHVGVEPGVHSSALVSLRDLEARVDGAASKKLEFLHYNTWLIRDNFKLADIVKALGGWGHFAACMGLSVAEILAGVLSAINTSGICDKLFPPIVSVCGVSVNPLNAGCKGLGLAGDLVALLIEKSGGALDWIFDLIEAPFNIVADVVFGILGSAIPLEAHIKPGKCMTDRLLEIGDQVFQYDITALCEVWRQEFKDELLARGPKVTPVLTGPADPSPGDWEHMGSGLMVFSPTFTIMDGGNQVYQKAGVIREMTGGCDFGGMVDADLFARKGIQRTLVDIGYGFIEVYSTHLYSGGDMPDAFGTVFGGEPSKAEKAEIRAAQIQQLAQYIDATHVPGNVAMVVGDFNVQKPERDSGNAGQPIFDPLLNTQNGLRFNDWYLLDTFILEDTAGKKDYDRKAGNTCRWGSDDNLTFPFFLPAVDPTGKNNFEDYCSEINPAEAEAEFNADARIDYIFVQKPEEAHTFNLDVSRIRRRVFARSSTPCVDEGPQYYLSDHVGLEVTLFVNPK